MAATDSPAGPSSAPAISSSTIYVNNLNEKVKLPILKTSLHSLFSTYGHVLSITAHSNIRLKGQAFVAFAEGEVASKAVKEVNGFPLYGKAMQCALAKTPSDSVVLKRQSRASPAFKEHKSARRARKAELAAAAAAAQKQGLSGAAGGVGGKRKREGEVDGQTGGIADASLPPPVKRAIPQLPDEYLPPNPLLFIQNLPEDNSVSREELEGLFADLEGLQDVRMIPGKAIAFVEFASAELAGRAREALNGRKVGTQIQEEAGQEVKGMRITFARV